MRTLKQDVKSVGAASGGSPSPSECSGMTDEAYERMLFSKDEFCRNVNLVTPTLADYISEDSIKGVDIRIPAELEVKARSLMADL